MTTFWVTLGKILNGAWFYDNIGNIFNYTCIVAGFIGFFIWMKMQANYNKKAAETEGQIK